MLSTDGFANSYTSDEEFKKTVVNLYENGKGISDLSREYGIAKSTIDSWIKKFKTIKNETVEVFKKNIETETERSISNLYKTIQINNSYDILRFGRRLLQNDKNAYKLLKSDWQNNFKNSVINVDVEVVIRRIGEESYHE